MILDDDHGGVFQFEEHEAEINESIGTYELKVARQSGARGKVAIPFTTEEGTAKAGKDFEHVEGEIIFCNEENAKTIEIPIMEEDSYEKNVVMYVVIGEPRHIAGPSGEGEGVDYAELDAKDPESLTEEEKIALLGRPRLGDVTKGVRLTGLGSCISLKDHHPASLITGSQQLTILIELHTRNNVRLSHIIVQCPLHLGEAPLYVAITRHGNYVLGSLAR